MNPWDRQKGESWQAYAAFMTYRDQGVARSYAAVSRASGKSETLMLRWAHRWSWVFRADQWDAHLQRIADETIRQQTSARAVQHVQMADALLAVAAKVLHRLSEQLDERTAAGKPAQRVSPSHAALAVEAVKLGRLLMGEATERTESDVVYHTTFGGADLDAGLSAAAPEAEGRTP